MGVDAGTVLGGLSLAIQLLDKCYKGYKLVGSGRTMPDDLHFLNVQLEIEHNRLKSFATAAEITNNENSLPRTIRAQASLLVPILFEIEAVLIKIAGDDGPISAAEPRPTIPYSGSSQAPHSFDILHKTTIQLSQSVLKQDNSINPNSRIAWSLSDKDRLIVSVSKLRQLNDSLYELLDQHQLHTLRDELRQTYMELVQVRESVKDLKTLADAAYSSRLRAHTSPQWQQLQDATLGDLASFKASTSSVLEHALAERESLIIPVTQILIPGEPSVEHVLQIAQHRDLYGVLEEVWLTWHYQQSTNICTSATQLTPVEELTALLKATRPDDFRIPVCLGFCIVPKPQTQQSRIAMVFQRPRHISSDIQPTNLLHAIKNFPRPSLTQRIALARSISKCLLYWHSVNWLHKAFRSEVILLFETEQHELQLCEPYLTGFDFSRRARWDESSAPKPRFGKIEAYLHPDAQFNRPPQYYRKTFDIYSLGIVLMEIACWRPIFDIMGIENDMERSPLSTSTIRARLLANEPILLADVRAEAGDKFTAAVRTCIEGRDAYGIPWTDRETSASTSLKIQYGFNSQVVRVLDEVVV